MLRTEYVSNADTLSICSDGRSTDNNYEKIIESETDRRWPPPLNTSQKTL